MIHSLILTKTSLLMPSLAPGFDQGMVALLCVVGKTTIAVKTARGNNA